MIAKELIVFKMMHAGMIFNNTVTFCYHKIMSPS